MFQFLGSVIHLGFLFIFRFESFTGWCYYLFIVNLPVLVLIICHLIDSSTPFSRGRPLVVLFAFLGPSTLFIGNLILTGDPVNKTPTRRVAPGSNLTEHRGKEPQ